MVTSNSSLDGVIEILVETLGIQDRASSLAASTPLFGTMPEFDSLAVVEVITTIEERFGIYVDDEGFGGDVFETIGTLADFVDQRRREA